MLEIKEKILNYKKENKNKTLPEYSRINTAEFIPDLSTKFILEYIPQHIVNLDTNIAIKITEHLCGWL